MQIELIKESPHIVMSAVRTGLGNISGILQHESGRKGGWNDVVLIKDEQTHLISRPFTKHRNYLQRMIYCIETKPKAVILSTADFPVFPATDE